ncbi:hypothetical protein WA026_019457 [Henosepilachna vigintioctopunctata]|uniref:PurM-like C-terminal domain-containing protein n=1 Tax=Henosepilachna vigintioctopunctata TaxID=420089 RepID=A0AAW1UAP8_9CUCU
MAARVDQEVVKAPGTLVISTYAPCPDIRKVVTPDLKAPSMGQTGVLLFIDSLNDHNRLGGFALAQTFNQLGDECPDVESVKKLSNAFKANQKLIKDGVVLSEHDVSDGGVIVCLLEMCFGGISGMEVTIGHRQGNALSILFSEEVGWVLEVLQGDLQHCLKTFKESQKLPE